MTEKILGHLKQTLQQRQHISKNISQILKFTNNMRNLQIIWHISKTFNFR